MGSRLPIHLRPADSELTASYLTRLASMHGLPFSELWSQVSSRHRLYGNIASLDGELLVAVTGQTRDRLSRALVELRGRRTDWRALRHEPQPGCHRCNARHLGGTVIQLLGHHDYACTRHRVWIGPPDLPDHPQPRLEQLPEVVAAQHTHRRLLRRLGPAATYDAVLTGFLICARRWEAVADSHKPGPDDAWHHWTRRSDLLIPPGTEETTFSASRLFAAVYPETIAISALIGSLHWRRLAAGKPTDRHRFATEIGRRLGQPDYQPQQSNDPIAQWIEQTCWRPPSQPGIHFRMDRTFGGNSYRKPDKRGIASNLFRAQQFAGDRNRPTSLIYHRTLATVRLDIRDHRRETTAAKLNGHQPHNTNDDSTFWDTATEPIDWPPRPRQSTRSRPGPWPRDDATPQQSAN
ncbi:hypothetical protein [Alloactinosynnema sp. L-07]|uniref:TniQ family protein n=1 Tax=Alloactinosynnema sp. L-07 TaxID=1653480 RepID=UPI00065EFE1A|nr:TniQ family protein [Alloactinosynnema sp. L-07]CRK55298.1 hypothetical protein [Alloactinosynnema sp. L-07]